MLQPRLGCNQAERETERQNARNAIFPRSGYRWRTWVTHYLPRKVTSPLGYVHCPFHQLATAMGPLPSTTSLPTMESAYNFSRLCLQ